MDLSITIPASGENSNFIGDAGEEYGSGIEGDRVEAQFNSDNINMEDRSHYRQSSQHNMYIDTSRYNSIMNNFASPMESVTPRTQYETAN